MIGSSVVAEILQKDYGVEDLTPYEDISYEIMHLSPEVSRVKIKSKTGRRFCSPVYAMFDGYYMSWYGDYGFWGFCCTWKTNIANLAYNSPYYQLEKLESGDRKEFNEDACTANLLKIIKDGDWYKDELTDEQRIRLEKFIVTSYSHIYSDDVLYEHEDICEKLKRMYQAAEEGEIAWHSTLRDTGFDECIFRDIFDCEEYELYDIGNKAPARFFIVLYMLSVVAALEEVREHDD